MTLPRRGGVDGLLDAGVRPRNVEHGGAHLGGEADAGQGEQEAGQRSTLPTIADHGS